MMMMMRTGAVVLVVLLAVSGAAHAQYFAGSGDCPPKSGDVYTLGLMGSPNAFYSAWLASEHAVNGNALSAQPSVGCFDFDITFFTGDEGASEELVCRSDEDWPYLDPDPVYGDCEDLCFPVNALRYDTNCDAPRGAPGAEYLFDKSGGEIIGLVGAGCSGPTIEAANWLEEKNIPLISPSATSARLSSVEDHPNFFRTCPGDAGQSKALVEVAASFGITRAAAIATRDAYSQGFADGIVEFAPGDGIEITTYELICTDTDCSESYDEIYEAVQKIKDTGVKVIFSTSHCRNNSVIRSIGEELGMTSQNCYMWMGGDGMADDECYDDMNTGDIYGFYGENGEYGPGLPYESSLGNVGTYPRGGTGDIYKDFMGFWAEQDVCTFPGQIHDEGQTELAGYSTEAYDAVLAYAMAIKRIREAGGEVTPEAVIAELDKPDFTFEGATGIVSFGGEYTPPIGDHDRPPIYDIKAFEGRWLTVGYWSPIDIVAVNFLLPIIFPTAVFDPPVCLQE